MCSVLMRLPGENNLSFIETSALDASNVELAFQNILTGMPKTDEICWQLRKEAQVTSQLTTL
jgi:hypothetical protein